MTLEVCTAVQTWTAVFWVVKVCSHVDLCQRSAGTFLLPVLVVMVALPRYCVLDPAESQLAVSIVPLVLILFFIQRGKLTMPLRLSDLLTTFNN
jgi:hypothetical protein